MKEYTDPIVELMLVCYRNMLVCYRNTWPMDWRGKCIIFLDRVNHVVLIKW